MEEKTTDSKRAVSPFKLAAAKATGHLSRLARRGGGTTLPGKALLKLDSDALQKLASSLELGCAVISATNGKTTTATVVADAITGEGIPLVHNRTGANMAGGVTSALLKATSNSGRLKAKIGLFEVDEFWLDSVVTAAQPRVLLLANLFRDQLDRYGELETIAERWAQVVDRQNNTTRIVLNADDPLVADLGKDRDCIYFGVEDPSLALEQLDHASDSKHCRSCGTPYDYEIVYLGHLGVYRCPNCGARRPTPTVTAHSVTLNGTRSASFTLRTPAGERKVNFPLPGLYNVYNGLAAAALCTALGFSLDRIVTTLESVAPAFGRAERVQIDGNQIAILLIKNPAGANEVIRTLKLEDDTIDLFAVLNDKTADGHDVSWVWDADFEHLADKVRSVVCSGTRAAELAVRFKYAGVDQTKIQTVPSLTDGLNTALAIADGVVYALPTYTAMLELRELFARRGVTQRYWQ